MSEFKSSTLFTDKNSIVGYDINQFAGNLLLFERFEAALLERLSTNPSSEVFLLKLANCKRQLGKLDQAYEIYNELKKINTDYAYMAAAVKGALNDFSDTFLPYPNISPIFEWPNLLPEKSTQAIFQYIKKHQSHFSPSGLGGKERTNYNKELRNNTQLVIEGTSFYEEVKTLIISQLSHITKSLGLMPFKLLDIELKLRAYHDKEYFRVHQDGGKGRLISFVYFLYPEPKRYDGGDLVIFDTDTIKSTFSSSFTRIIPKNNSLFFFPSNFYHAALPVSTKDNNFFSARFALNGHIWTK